MSTLQNKIDFVALITVNNANSNGDPLNGNRPRTDYNGFGEISDVCIKRKIRNRMQDLGNEIFVKSDDRCDDNCHSLKERADKNTKLKPCIASLTQKNKNGNTTSSSEKEKFKEVACKEWMDVRSFGQVFAFWKKNKGTDSEGISVGIRGPVSIHLARSISIVDDESFQITKSVNGKPGDEQDNDKMSSDRFGMKHFVRFGLYEIKGSINVQLAEKTGFTEEDAETIKECLRTLFVNDASSARPDGSMEVVKLYWWRHNCKDGQYSSACVHRSVVVEQKDTTAIPTCLDDYKIDLVPLEGLEPEVIEGV